MAKNLFHPQNSWQRRQRYWLFWIGPQRADRATRPNLLEIDELRVPENRDFDGLDCFQHYNSVKGNTQYNFHLRTFESFRTSGIVPTILWWKCCQKLRISWDITSITSVQHFKPSLLVRVDLLCRNSHGAMLERISCFHIQSLSFSLKKNCFADFSVPFLHYFGCSCLFAF